MKLDLASKRPSLPSRLWLRLGALLGKLLLLLVVLGLAGWALASIWFAWQHRGPVASQEQIPADEAARTQDIIQIFRARRPVAPGDKIHLKPRANSAHLFDKETGKRVN